MSFVSSMYRAVRLANDVAALTSGHPRRIVRRAKNHVLGRALARVGFWKKLWR